MIESENRELLKIFVLCLLIHIIILPIFSLTLPVKTGKPKYYHVYLYQQAQSKTTNTIEKRINPQLPSTKIIEKTKIEIPLKELGKLEKNVLVGFQKTPIMTVEHKDNINWELPVPEITHTSLQHLPRIQENEFQSQGKITSDTFEITGPGGTRQIISKVIPEYPAWAEQQNIEANVKIKIWVNKDGIVFSTEVFETSGYRKLDILAEETLKKWKFSNIEEDINVWAVVTFKFRLK